MKIIIRFSFLLLSLFILTACGGGGGGTGSDTTTAPGVDPNYLVVSSVSPVSGAIQKADFPVTAIFSEAVDDTLVNSNSFAVMNGASPVAGTFSFSSDKTVVIFTPVSDLADGVSYTVTLDTSLASLTKKNLAANKSWSFTASAKVNYSCTITTPPASLGLDAYYTKYCNANGMPILGGNLVSVAALQKAWLQTMNMMKMRQDLYAEMIKQGTKVAIVAEGEGITQIPEYSDLDTVYPIVGGWDARSRGFGATPTRPISSGAEENLLCYVTDRYIGENIFIHELAHSVRGMGIFFAEPALNGKIQTAYADALANGLYANTYADNNVYEYWAEGVQNWFNVNIEAIPSNGVHNEINTRAELKVYDPALYNIISTIFPTDWQPACP